MLRIVNIFLVVSTITIVAAKTAEAFELIQQHDISDYAIVAALISIVLSDNSG